ncbi:MAG TPA: hypothetical protein VG826_04205 [Pirellulales bacterium]|nr:hypothetical protein [Pirellulales bacterium]
MWFSGYVYLLPGDGLSLVAVATGNDEPTTISVDGSLTWFKQSNNALGTFGIAY